MGATRIKPLNSPTALIFSVLSNQTGCKPTRE